MTGLWSAVLSAFLQLAVLGGLPLLIYFAFHKVFHKRGFKEVAQRAGLQPCPPRYLLISALLALGGVAAVLIWSPPLEPLLRQGSAQRQFAGLGLSTAAIVRAFLHGVVQTGLSEELLFRGLIAGALSRRLPVAWANIAQALIFLLPHLLILRFAPEMAGLLPLVFVGALVLGWIRIKSGSIIGPWLMHASGNVTMALSVAVRTVNGTP